MPDDKHLPRPSTSAHRQAAYRNKGRGVAFVLNDEKAMQKLAALEVIHGGVKAAVTAALRGARMPVAPRPSRRRAALPFDQGRNLALILTDEKAMQKLVALAAVHGGIKAAVTAALRDARIR